jgi:hypothetical protein
MAQQTLLTTVVAIQNNPVAAGTPNTGDTLVWNGSAWASSSALSDLQNQVNSLMAQVSALRLGGSA